MCASLADGSHLWLSLKDIKESNPVECAEYASAMGIDIEPAFKWWVSHTLRRRERIIKAIVARVAKRTHKYGVRVPRSVKEALQIDEENGDSFWKDAIKLEMKNVDVAFKYLEEGAKQPVGYKKIPVRLIFDVKWISPEKPVLWLEAT